MLKFHKPQPNQNIIKRHEKWKIWIRNNGSNRYLVPRPKYYTKNWFAYLFTWFLLMKREPKSICFVKILKLATEELEIRLVSEWRKKFMVQMMLLFTFGSVFTQMHGLRHIKRLYVLTFFIILSKFFFCLFEHHIKMVQA